MTYSEYRSQFKTVEEFRYSFGKLTEEEARALIAAENTSTTGKAAMMSSWRMERKEVPDESRLLDQKHPSF